MLFNFNHSLVKKWVKDKLDLSEGGNKCVYYVDILIYVIQHTRDVIINESDD